MTTTTLRLPPRIARLPQLRQIVRGGLAARGSVGAGLAAKAGGAAVALQPVSGAWLWLDASAVTGSDGDAVATWNDTSGNARHFDGTGHAPTLKTNIINGHAVVRNTASNYTIATLALPMTNTIHIVASYASGSHPAGILATTDPINLTSVIPKFLLNTNTGPILRILDNATYGTLGAISAGAFWRATMTHDSSTTSRSGWLNGTKTIDNVAYGLTGSNSRLTTHVGYFYNFVGDIAEIIIYDSVLSPADLATNDAYLVAKYDL